MIEESEGGALGVVIAENAYETLVAGFKLRRESRLRRLKEPSALT